MPQRNIGQNFNPFGNYTIAATNASQDITITQPALGRARDMTISNNTSSVAFLAWGATTQTADSTGFAVLPGAIMTIDLGQTPVTHVACILATGTGNVYISIGHGT